MKGCLSSADKAKRVEQKYLLVVLCSNCHLIPTEHTAELYICRGGGLPSVMQNKIQSLIRRSKLLWQGRTYASVR